MGAELLGPSLTMVAFAPLITFFRSCVSLNATVSDKGEETNRKKGSHSVAACNEYSY